MLLGAEIGFALWGLMTVVVGVAHVPPYPTVRGAKARLLGLIALLPLGLIFPLGAIYRYTSPYHQWTPADVRPFAICLEIGLLIAAAAAQLVLARMWSRSNPPG